MAVDGVMVQGADPTTDTAKSPALPILGANDRPVARDEKYARWGQTH
jgi:hypothetical protein